MKKLLLLLIFPIFFVHADSPDQAIEQAIKISDVQSLQQLLQNEKLSESDLERFLELADDIVDYKKESWNFYAGKNKDHVARGISFMLGGSFLMRQVSKKIAWNVACQLYRYPRDPFESSSSPSILSAALTPINMALAATAAGLFWAAYQEKENYFKQMEQNYYDALAIKQLLLKHKS